MSRRPLRALASSVGTKVLIALTGLALLLYLVLHLAGNLFIFAGPATFNEYGHKLAGNKPLLYTAEIGLAAIFLVHVYKAFVNWRANNRARPVAYAEKKWAGHTSRKSIGSTTMIYTGLVTLFFIVVHVKGFKYGPLYQFEQGPARDLYRLEVEAFRNPLWVAFYVACMVVIGLHLRHGISSAFQSLGLEHPRYTRRLLVVGLALAVAIAGGFAIIPIWVYFGGLR